MKYRLLRQLGVVGLFLLLHFSFTACSGDGEGEEGLENNVNNAAIDEEFGDDLGDELDTNLSNANLGAGNGAAAGAINDVINEANANPVGGVPASSAPVEGQFAEVGQPAFVPGSVAQGSSAGPGLPELGAKMPYIVQRGDTLARISSKIYGTTERWREIAELTDLRNANRIYPGDVVFYQLTEESVAFASGYENAPRGEVVVQPGDTLASIAANVFGTSADWRSLWRENDTVTDPDSLAIGQTIFYSQGHVHSGFASLGEISRSRDRGHDDMVLAIDRENIHEMDDVVQTDLTDITVYDDAVLAADLEDEQENWEALFGASDNA